MCFYQDEAISYSKSKSLKLVDCFQNIGCNISSTERNVNINVGKSIECYVQFRKYFIILFPWKNKTGIFPSNRHVSTTVGLHHFKFNETLEKKSICEPHKVARCCFEQILDAAPHRASSIRLLIPDLKYSIKINRTRHAGNRWQRKDKGVTFSCGILHNDMLMLSNQKKMHLSALYGHRVPSR